jgi:glycine/D-amino acid oxidase-like deaminating enzyme
VGGHAVVVGSGVFGVTTALALSARGWSVSLTDPGPVPHPQAASTDISKVVRMAYGADEELTALAERAREGWIEWNAEWMRGGGRALYHETGVLMLSRERLARDGFEYESLAVLRRRGHHPERLDAAALARRFPDWAEAGYTDGFFDAHGGYAESGEVVARLVDQARRRGVDVRDHRAVDGILTNGARVVGVTLAGGERLAGDAVVAAAGVWTEALLGGGTAVRATGHPVFHLRPSDPAPFGADRFPTFTADIARTGFYGFPLHRTGVVKVANHSAGRVLAPDAPRAVTEDETARMRRFVRETFPGLADAEVVSTRLCLYADTPDGDFWIGRDPARPGLTVATGGSGHAFKFAPVLGNIVADAVEGVANPYTARFGVPPRDRTDGAEAARHRGPA